LKLSEIGFDNFCLCFDRLSKPLHYDRSAITPGIVHLGVGAFARAHLAVYVDSVLGNRPQLSTERRVRPSPSSRNKRVARQGDKRSGIVDPVPRDIYDSARQATVVGRTQLFKEL
jgi:hypothetical protein